MEKKIIKTIKISKKEMNDSKKLQKKEQGFRRVVETVGESIQDKHDIFWDKLIKKYGLKRNTRYFIDDNNTLNEYIEKKETLDEMIQQQFLEMLTKKNQGVNLNLYGIDMVK